MTCNGSDAMALQDRQPSQEEEEEEGSGGGGGGGATTYLAPEWPRDDALLARLRRRVDGDAKDDDVEEIVSPILTFCPKLPVFTIRPEGEEYRSYFSFCPAVVPHLFYSRKTSRLDGACLFGSASSMGDRASEGAILACLDNVLGVYAIHHFAKSVLTQKLVTTFSATVPVNFPVKLECWIEPAPDGKKTYFDVRGKLLCPTTGGTLVSACGIFRPSQMEFPRISGKPKRSILSELYGSPRRFPLERIQDTWPKAVLLAEGDLKEQGYAAMTPRLVTKDSIFDFAPATVPKLRLKSVWKKGKNEFCGVVHFSRLVGGPPGRVNGGSILSAFAHVFGSVRCSDALKLRKLDLTFKKGTKLGCFALVFCSSKELHGACCAIDGKLLVLGEPNAETCVASSVWRLPGSKM